MIDTIKQLDVVNSYADLPAGFYTRLAPQGLNQPRLLHANSQVAGIIGLSETALSSPEFLAVCAGADSLPGGISLAAVYSGHQFGVWAGQLGDGRAHLLGEVVTPAGGWEWQLKGSGRTPYSRMGDGRAVLGSSVREYLASAAMSGLGIPTSQALAIVVSDDPVYRETVETAAIVSRLAPSFIRFGTFEHWAASPEQLTVLFNYVVDRYYPECRDSVNGEPANQTTVVLRFLKTVVERTARMVADWQTVGFCHGVMNTDNMSILGLTIDYGPYGFMDAFQANHICNHTDTQGRYAWNAQPSVAHWNLYRLASALLPLGPDADALKEVLQCFEATFLHAFRNNLCKKMGWLQWQDGDEALINNWWQLLHTTKADFTLSFRELAQAPAHPKAYTARFADPAAADAWLQTYLLRLKQQAGNATERIASMNRANPLYVLRNHLAETAIQAAKQGDASEITTLLGLLQDPYTEKSGYESYAAVPPDWACTLEVSCSS